MHLVGVIEEMSHFTQHKFLVVVLFIRAVTLCCSDSAFVASFVRTIITIRLSQQLDSPYWRTVF